MNRSLFWDRFDIRLFIPQFLYSKGLVLSFLGLLGFFEAGCSSAHFNVVEIQRDSIAASRLSTMYGTLHGPAIDTYLLYLEHRLGAGLPVPMRRPFEITLIDLKSPLAASPTEGTIVLSRGLIGRLMSEAELVFVISHELSHQVLGHLERLDGLESDDREEFERRADLNALGIMALAGYDPRAAISALINAYSARGDEKNSFSHTSDYPSLEERVNSAKEAIDASGWHPPGTLDRRDFQVFKVASSFR